MEQLPGMEGGLPEGRDALLGASNGRPPIDPDVLADATSFLRGRARKKVAQRVVTEEEMRKAAAALTAYRQASGRRPSLGPWLTKLVSRVRDYPSWTEWDFVRVVESAWRLRWWEKRSGRPPTPAVIFGNERCFERIVQDFHAEAAGEKKGRRYGREVIR
jgi:hypothetical protein